MKKKSKRYEDLLKLPRFNGQGVVSDIIPFLKKSSTAKFDESVDVSFQINKKNSKTDIGIRTVVNLPNGTGKKVKIAVLCEEAKIDEAKSSGAEIYGSEDLIEKISKGQMDFDKLVATTPMMIKISKLGKILGPKGLMPNPKLGTVTNDIKSTVNSLKTGQVEIRSDKDGNIAASIGKKSFSDVKLKENFEIIAEAILKEKPINFKGNFILSSFITSSMGLSHKVNVTVI